MGRAARLLPEPSQGGALGTALTPVFAIFFPVPAAVAMTVVVHLANNLFKIGLVGRSADWGTVARFGLPAALAAIAGASLLAYGAAFHAGNWAVLQGETASLVAAATLSAFLGAGLASGLL